MSLLQDAIGMFFNVLYILLVARILLSWFPAFHHSRLMDLLCMVTEPMLAPIRNLIQRSPLGGPGMMLDFSPIIVIFILHLLRAFVAGLF